MRGIPQGALANQPQSGSARAESARGSASITLRSLFLQLAVLLRSFGRQSVPQWAGWALLIAGGLAILGWAAEPGAIGEDASDTSVLLASSAEPNETVWDDPLTPIDSERAVIEAETSDSDPEVLGVFFTHTELLLTRRRDVSCHRRTAAETIHARFFEGSRLARAPPAAS